MLSGNYDDGSKQKDDSFKRKNGAFKRTNNSFIALSSKEFYIFIYCFNWRKQGDREEIVEVKSDVCITIPTGTHFQFRNTGNAPLRFVITTMPPWPGEQEAVRVQDYWK